MNKKNIITSLLALIALTGWAQSTKTATITGYSPALKDGTLVFASTGPCAGVVDTVQAGHFAYTLPVEGFILCYVCLCVQKKYKDNRKTRYFT